MNEEEIQKKYAEIQILNQNFQQIQEQISLLNNQLEVLIKVDETLDSVKEVKEKTSILVPIGGGIFMRADVSKETVFLVNVGGDVLLKKNFDESKNVVKEQTKEVSRIIGQLETNLQVLSERSQEIQEGLSKHLSNLETKKQ